MMPERRHARPLRRYGNAAAALLASILVLGLLGAGLKTIPALGPALVPGHGAWESAAGGKLPGAQTLSLPGLSAPARVSFSKQGIATVSAATDTDAYLALGYVHASFRLTQLDLERRIAAGRLAQLAGPAGVASDKFELRLGLTRIAQQEWAAMPKSSPAARALVAYSRGVNDYLAQVRASGHWPAVYALAGVYPANWTPVDSLLVQGALTQQLDFSTAPLDYAVLARSLGAQQTSQWFPVLPPGNQNPWDRGPYKSLGTAALTSASEPAAGTPVPAATAVSAGTATAAGAILAETAALPAGQIHTAPDSNAWAANGPKVAGGGAMLGRRPAPAADAAVDLVRGGAAAPGLQVSGVSVPGMPGGLDRAQRAHRLVHHGRAEPVRAVLLRAGPAETGQGSTSGAGSGAGCGCCTTTIPVRGGATRQLTVDQTVHGPILTQAGQTVSVDWMGAGPPDLGDMLALDQAAELGPVPGGAGELAVADARTSSTPTTAATSASIARRLLPAGRAGATRGCRCRAPAPTTSPGVIPYAAVPQVYDPPSHVIVAGEPAAGHRRLPLLRRHLG